MKIQCWNSTNNTNLRLSLFNRPVNTSVLQPMTWDEEMRIIVFSKSCLPPQVLATTIATANYSISMYCALNFLAHNSTLPVWIIIFPPSWRHGNLMKENRKPINHQPSRLCWNQYTLPTKPVFLPTYWWGEAFQGRYDFLVQHEGPLVTKSNIFLTGPHHINNCPEEKHSRMLRFKEISLLAKCSIGMKRLFSPVSTVKTAWKRCCISRTINRRPTDQQSTRQSYSEEDRLHDWVGLLKVL